MLALLLLALNSRQVHSQQASPEPLPQVTCEPTGCECQFECGKPYKVIDGVGWVFGIPKKLILWNRRAVNHNVSNSTQQELTQYIDANSLTSTKVRINQYDPWGEWHRLRTNKQVGAGWRYTLGALDTLVYTVLPGRVFGVDAYNPYTDSVYIYSDIPCLAQEQAAYAKLIRAHQHPGTYAAFSSLPIARLWPAHSSKQDVLDYTLMYGTLAKQDEAARVFYPEFGSQVGGDVAVFVGGQLPLTLAGAGIGHLAVHANSTPAIEQPTTAADVAASTNIAATPNVDSAVKPASATQ